MPTRPEFYYCEKRRQYRKRVTLDGRTRDLWADTKDELRARIRELQNATDRGLVLDDETTVAQFAAQWYEVKRSGIRPRSAEVYANAINNHICPTIGRLRLKDVKPLHIGKLMTDKAELARSSQSKILFTMKQMFAAAEENGLVLKNPCTGIKPGGGVPQPRKALNDAQQAELLDVSRDTRGHVFVVLALYAGLRRAEALGLMWDSVYLDEEMPYLTVRRAVSFENNRGTLSDALKSKAAARNIPLPPPLVEVLRVVKEASKSDFVIPAADGEHMSLIGFRRLWETATRGLSFQTVPHELRHTYITRLCAAGVDIKKVQYLAGHEDVKMTLNVYAHVTQNQPAELGRAIAGVF